MIDKFALEALTDSFNRAIPNGLEDLRRVNELRDESVSHDWLWSIDGGLDHHEFIAAVRVRLGAQHFDEPQLCQACGSHILNPQCTHAHCCAPGENTRGHNNVRDVIIDFARLGDSTAEPEVLGLISSAPGLRPGRYPYFSARWWVPIIWS